jgi:hypothetical protein
VLAAIAVVLGCYAAVLVTARLLADPNVPFDDRILAPAILLLEAAVATALGVWWAGRGAAARVVAALLVAGWLAAAAWTTLDHMTYALEEGADLAGSRWRESPLVAWVRARPPGTPLFTNWPPALYFHTHRAARDVPGSLDPALVRAFGDTLRRRSGVVVGFAAPTPDYAPPDSLAARLGLRRVASFADGAAWVSP